MSLQPQATARATAHLDPARDPGRHRAPEPRRGTELDARCRPPPDPLSAIRAAISELAPDDVLQVRTQAEPIALVLMLASPALAVSAVSLPDQTWRVTIRRR
ncbi:MAG: DUF2249 domain-containing protein [Opitutaceae bacterium]|nr:DUF2249 domain-containing protein [Opitutaceae bacterium]